ncbi:MAG: hypothetical protein IJC39_01700 [Firmicutes bacterium]|nr:hypothetical protein [Bacillota bacterium]
MGLIDSGGFSLVRKTIVTPSVTLDVIDRVYPFHRNKNYRCLVIKGSDKLYSAVPLSAQKNELLLYSYCGSFIDALDIKNPHRFLVLGGGGGTVPRFFALKFPRSEIDFVEISPEITEVAKKYFIPKYVSNINYHVCDALIFAESCSSDCAYEFIFVDLFAGDRPLKLKIDLLKNLRSANASGGAVVFNLFKSREFAEEYLTDITAVFSYVFVFIYSEAYIVLATDETGADKLKPFVKKVLESPGYLELEFFKIYTPDK